MTIGEFVRQVQGDIRIYVTIPIRLDTASTGIIYCFQSIQLGLASQASGMVEMGFD